MRAFFVIGCVLIVLGLVALAVPSVTYFAADRLVDAKFFLIDPSKPHTVMTNPIAGGITMVGGVLLVALGCREGLV